MGRIRLSQTFYLRDFLHSEIAAAFDIVNIPDDLGLAVETGAKLCAELLEPLQDRFGPIRIRSGYRSSSLNAFGHEQHLNCAGNAKNHATHIWDRQDAEGRKGASACVVVPSLTRDGMCQSYIEETLSEWGAKQPLLDHMRFFKQPATFNIGWKSLPPECVQRT